MENRIPGYNIDIPAKVYYIPLERDENLASLAEKTQLLLKKSNCTSIIKKKSIVAVKQHLGEWGNQTYIKPEIAKVIVDMIKSHGAFPMLVETNTLYKGSRSDTYHHLILAHEHGFSIENTGAPLMIMDGLKGQNQRPVSIPGKHYKKVFMAPDIPFFDSIFVLSHVKGHMLTGMGGALKNLGMGFASRAGKLNQHDDFHPKVNDRKCIRCGLCVKYCPENALQLINDKITINLGKCIGCGECFTACRYNAITFNWSESDRDFQEKMVEHALGAVINHNKKIIYINFFNNITKQCDCWGNDNPILYPDIGIFASLDPVAVDRACFDMAEKNYNINIFKQMWKELDSTIQLDYGEQIGIGTQEYELIEVS